MAHTRYKLRVTGRATISDMKTWKSECRQTYHSNMKSRIICFSACFGNVSAEAVDDLISSLNFAIALSLA
jgi:hypothetical protein